MKVVADFLSSPLAERIGLTLLHSIWQLTLVAMVGYLLLGCLRRFSPNLRYVVSYVVLLTMGCTLAPANCRRLVRWLLACHVSKYRWLASDSPPALDQP